MLSNTGFTIHRMLCRSCGRPFDAGDKDPNRENYARVTLPVGVKYDPKRHCPGDCVDCYMAYSAETEEIGKRIEYDIYLAEEEKAHTGVWSEATIKREIEAGRLDLTQGLYEFMASVKAGMRPGN